MTTFSNKRPSTTAFKLSPDPSAGEVDSSIGDEAIGLVVRQLSIRRTLANASAALCVALVFALIALLVVVFSGCEVAR